MRLILARHGQSFANTEPARYENLPAPLTALGEQQADRLGQWLKRHEPEIDLIMCSAILRAQQTAEIVNQYLAVPLVVNENLNEIETWDYPYLHRRAHPFKLDTLDTSLEDGVYSAFRIRVQRALDEITSDLSRPKPMLVVSHGGTSATLLRLIVERHDMYFITHNTGLHFVEWDDGRWRIKALNQTRHLPDELIS